MNKKIKENIKLVGGLVLGFGVTGIVKGIIKNNTNEEEKGLGRLCIGLSGIVIGMMAGDKVISYFNDKVDKFGIVEKNENHDEEIKEEK